MAQMRLFLLLINAHPHNHTLRLTFLLKPLPEGKGRYSFIIAY